MGRGATLTARMPIIIPRLDEPDSVSAEERDEHLMLLEAARHQLDVEWAGTLAVFDEGSDHHLFGYPSTVAYLKDRMGMAGGRAHRYVRTARMVRRFASTFSAWRHRLVSSDEAEVLLAAADRDPEEYATAEAGLLELAGDGYDETRRVIDYWQSEVNTAGRQLELEAQLARRRFELTRRPNGMVTGEFELSQLAGESLRTAIDVLMPPPSAGDSRSTRQRRADALEDLARNFLDGTAIPIVGGERPHISVHVTLDALAGGPGGLHETADGHVLDPATIEQLSCDASVARIVFGPDSEVLDVGRKTRVIPTAIRRAVVARDRHCVAPGCSRSSIWCDVHHIASWTIDNGETEVNNLCLLCRYHHTLVHIELIELPAWAGTTPPTHKRRT